MPIHTYGGFTRMVQFCKTNVPDEITKALEPIKNDDKKVKAYGVRLGIEMCSKLIQAGIHGLHFYTLNLEATVRKILQGLKMISDPAPSAPRPLPWKTSPGRDRETVRPVFWANRPSAYIFRTQSWDDFPNGRWGDTRSPAFGTLSDYHLAHVNLPDKVRKEMWGKELKSEADVWNTFARYVKGEVKEIPWFVPFFF